MCRRNAINQAGVRATGGSRTGKRAASKRSTGVFLIVTKYSRSRLGSLGQGGRAERPLKIRNGHVEQGQAKASKQKRENRHLLWQAGTGTLPRSYLPGYPSPRAPAVTVATTRLIFVVCPVRPRDRQHRQAGWGIPSLPAGLAGYLRYLLTWPRPKWLVLARACVVCVACACKSRERKGELEGYSTYRNSVTSLTCRITHERP